MLVFQRISNQPKIERMSTKKAKTSRAPDQNPLRLNVLVLFSETASPRFLPDYERFV